MDITEPVTALPAGSFDVVPCMDVLFHIADDEGYRTAIENVARLLRPGGLFVFSENFLHRAEKRGARQVNRSLQWIETVLLESGFQPVRRRPMFVLMDPQVDAVEVCHRSWAAVLRAATALAVSGWFDGRHALPARTVPRAASR